ncbi:MAG: hypothetical protein ACLFP2_00945 [Candidatus Woesearchaeota archaeon]
MDKIVRKDTIKIIEESLQAIKQKEFSDLNELSNHTIHNASVFQDEYSISIAVVISSIAKITRKSKEIDPQIVYSLEKAKEYLEQKEDESYCEEIRKTTDLIRKSDERIHHSIQEVLRRAEIKKSSNIYYHGISLARAAELLGVSQWELMSFVGKTTIIDQNGKVKQDLKKKIKNVRDIFFI